MSKSEHRKHYNACFSLSSLNLDCYRLCLLCKHLPGRLYILCSLTETVGTIQNNILICHCTLLFLFSRPDSAFEMRSGSTSCMIPTRVQDSSEGECERSSRGSAAYPAGTCAFSRPQRMSSDQKTRSSGSSNVSADKKRKSCLSQLAKQNSTSPVPQKHGPSMKPQNLIQTSRTSDKRKDRSLSKKRTTETPQSDTQNQGVRAPVRPQQGMHDFRYVSKSRSLSQTVSVEEMIPSWNRPSRERPRTAAQDMHALSSSSVLHIELHH